MHLREFVVKAGFWDFMENERPILPKAVKLVAQFEDGTWCEVGRAPAKAPTFAERVAKADADFKEATAELWPESMRHPAYRSAAPDETRNGVTVAQGEQP